MSQDFSVKEGYMYGKWCKAVNAAAKAGAGSIHDDATGKKIGIPCIRSESSAVSAGSGN